MRLTEKLLSEQWAHWVAIGIGAVTLLFALTLTQTIPGKVLELRLLDERFAWRGPQTHDSPIVVLGIDAVSIESFRNQGVAYPWPNRIYAQAVDTLNQLGAKVIVFDKIFADPTGDADDQQLADASRKHGKVVYGIDLQQRLVEGNLQTYLEEPIKMIADSGALGFVNFPFDEDGAVRRFGFVNTFKGRDLRSMDLQAYLLYNSIPFDSSQIVFDSSREVMKIGDLSIPIYGECAYINYPGMTPFKEYSFYQIFDPEQKGLLEALGEFKDKIVYVGATIALFHDDYLTPFSRVSGNEEIAGTQRENGVHVHGSMLYTMLSGNVIKPIFLPYTVFFALLLGLVVVVLLSRAGFKLSILLSVGLALFYLMFGFMVFTRFNVYLNLMMPLAAIVFPSVAIIYYKFLYEQTQKRQIRSYWSRYVSDDIVDLMVKGKLSVELGGQRRELTILMSDIRDFTPICESLSPSDLITQLNEYFSEMAKAIFDNEGTIDKFIGDAVMAYWGFPHEQEDHPRRACLAAAEMIRRSDALRVKWEAEGKPTFRMGVGINTGEVIVGNVGAVVDKETIQNFTLLGDNVNLAARLESENKHFGTTIIASESTWSRVGEGTHLKAECLGEILVKGKSQAIRCFRLDLDESVKN